MASISAGGIGVIQAASNTEKSQRALKDAFRELASNIGSNQSADGAARLAIAERFNTEVQGVNQAKLNVNDGIAVIQITDAGLQQIQEGKLRLQELAVQSANGTLNDQDRQAIQAEASQIQEQISSVIADTNYNDISLLASNDKLNLQSGPGTGDQTGIKLTDYSNAFNTVDLSTQAGAASAIVTLSSDQDQISAARSELGATESALSSSVERLASLSEALSVAGSRIKNADIAEQSTLLATASIRARADVAIQAQANLSAARVQQLVA